MEFSNGNHLVNYCLKIFENKNIILSKYSKSMIVSLFGIYDFYKDLEDKQILKENKNRFNNIIDLCKGGDFNNVIQEIKSISQKINQCKIGEKNFYLEEYNIAFLTDSQNILNIYYPKLLEVVTISHAIDKAYLIKEYNYIENIKYGVYFIYDENNQIAYIGKSLSDVSFRCFESVKERNLYNFSKIEIRASNSKSDIGIYESYYISKFKPRLNKDLNVKDIVSLRLEDIPIGKTYIKDYSVFKDLDYDYYVKKKVTPTEYFSNNDYILTVTLSPNQLLKEHILTKHSSANFKYRETLENCKDDLGFYFYERY